MAELDHQRSAANTLVNKIGLDTFVLFNIFNYYRFASYSDFAFHYFILMNTESVFCECDELVHIHIWSLELQ